MYPESHMLKCTLNTPGGWRRKLPAHLAAPHLWLLTSGCLPVAMDEPYRGRHAGAERNGVHPQADTRASSKFTTPAHSARPDPDATQGRPQARYRSHDHTAHRQTDAQHPEQRMGRVIGLKVGHHRRTSPTPAPDRRLLPMFYYFSSSG